MNSVTPRAIEVIRYDAPVSYDEAHDAQMKRWQAVADGSQSSALFLLEHQPVITLGRNSNARHLLVPRERYAELGIELREVDRGGDVTYHGPGQLVAYPVLDLSHWKRSVRWYLRALEEVLIRTLSAFNLVGERVAGHTGVWVNDAKVAQIGVGLRRWITYHGIALNVAPQMAHFETIVPCGIHDKPVTSMKSLLGVSPSVSVVMDEFTSQFLTLFAGWQLEEETCGRNSGAVGRPATTDPILGVRR